MLIGLSGKAQSGKDTVADYLVEHYDFRRIAFADKLKDAFAALFDVPRDLVDELKLNKNATVCLLPTWLGGEEPVVAVGSWMRKYSVRESLQRFGTEVGREVFGTDFWVDLAFDMNTSFEAQRGRIVVSDCRFPNEFKKIKSLGGYNIRIERPDNEFEAGDHVSEDEPDPNHIDHVIVNRGDLSFLFDSVGMLMDKLDVLPAQTSTS